MLSYLQIVLISLFSWVSSIFYTHKPLNYRQLLNINNKTDSSIKPFKGPDNVLYDEAIECDSIKSIFTSSLDGFHTGFSHIYYCSKSNETITQIAPLTDTIEILAPNHIYTIDKKQRVKWFNQDGDKGFNQEIIRKDDTIIECDSIWRSDALYYVRLKGIKAIIVKETFIGKAQK